MTDSLSDCRFYGEEELPPHELRMMSAFNAKIANFNRITIKGRQRFRMKYLIRPRKQQNTRIMCDTGAFFIRSLVL
ncbi:MAG: hypothetical protein V8T27_00710 [Ruminococcus bicirculans (ex Wegman et al. 2014)]